MHDSIGSAMTSDASWNDFRCKMPVTERLAYFDHAAVAPLTAGAHAAMVEYAEDVAHFGGVNWAKWRSRIETTRNVAATLINADRNETAIIRNTTEGIGLVAEGFPWQPGDNVVVPAREFPSNLFAWQNLAARGVETRLISADHPEELIDRAAAAIDRRTRLVAISWVDYASGWRINPSDWAELAHRNDALLFLDAIQALGVFPLDVEAANIDFLAADGHKWMLGPEGAGIFFIAEQHLDRLRPLGVGWNSVKNAGDFSNSCLKIKNSAARYEGGTYNMATAVALGESLALLTAQSGTETAGRLIDVGDEVCRRLEAHGIEIASRRGPTCSSGIISVEAPAGEDPQSVRHRCLANDVVVNCRNGRIRISPHVYTSADDIERLVTAICNT